MIHERPSVLASVIAGAVGMTLILVPPSTRRRRIGLLLLTIAGFIALVFLATNA